MYSYAISLTSFNKAGKEFRISDPIVQGRKRVQNFGPHAEGKEKGSEFLTPDILWRLSIIVPVDAAVGSEFLTRDNL